MLKKVIIAIVCCLPVWAVWVALAESDYIVTRDVPEWFAESFYDVPDDVVVAAEQNKRVMLYFGQDGCGACAQLHAAVFNHPDFRDKLVENIHAIAINIHGNVEVQWVDGEALTEKSLATKLKAEITPSLLFLDESGETVLHLFGYKSPKQIDTALDYVIGRHEQRMTFAEFRGVKSE